MSEPGAVSGAVVQGNAQGFASFNTFPQISVQNQGLDAVPGYATTGGVGFSNDTAVPSKDGTGNTGENDEVEDNEVSDTSIPTKSEEGFKTEYLPESPFYMYNVKPSSSGVPPSSQKYHNSRRLGRGMNMDNIRNGNYYSTEEASIFTWGLSSQYPNITMDEVEQDNDETIRDV